MRSTILHSLHFLRCIGESNSTSEHSIRYKIAKREQLISFDSITSFTILKALRFILAIITASQALLLITT